MKFDTSTIDGFENMSDADKVTALLGVDLPGPVDTKNLVKKEDFDKVMSEASSYKKQLKEKMTAEETAAAEAKAAQEKLQNDYNALLKENTISKNVTKYIALGYDEKLAKSTAEALFDGDMETVFANAARQAAMPCRVFLCRELRHPGSIFLPVLKKLPDCLWQYPGIAACRRA
jgi:hypothetical protein